MALPAAKKQRSILDYGQPVSPGKHKELEAAAFGELREKLRKQAEDDSEAKANAPPKNPVGRPRKAIDPMELVSTYSDPDPDQVLDQAPDHSRHVIYLGEVTVMLWGRSCTDCG